MTRFVGNPLKGTNFSAAGDEAISARVDGEAVARIRIDAGGRITWGGGASAGDVTLYRDEADVLKTDDTFKAPVLFIDGIEVDTTGAVTDDVLKFNGTKFFPSATGGGGGASNLNQLDDVTLTSPESYQVLRYDGTEWINEFPTTVSLVENAETTTLAVGEVVYLYGGTGNHASVKRADNGSDTTSSKTVGVVATAISSGAQGPVVTRGYVDGIDLSTGYSAGDVLWLGESGAFTTTKPSSPDHLVFVGVVVRATNNGIIYVATQNGYELEEIHDVSLTSLASGDFLKWNGTLWVNDAINLGTDTVGNYVSDVTAGTGVTVTHTPGEGSSPTVAIGQAVGTSDTPTFANVVISSAPSQATHAVTKEYVDNIAAGIDWHESARLATAAALPNSPSYSNGTSGVGATLTATTFARLSVDGANATTGDRVLVKNQASATENGIYLVTEQGNAVDTYWILTRATDLDSSPTNEIKTGEAVFVTSGSTNANQGFVLTTTGSGTGGAHVLNTDSLTFTQFTGTQAFSAGNGLTKTGNTLDVVTADSSRIVVNADSVDLATVAQSNSSGADTASFISDINVDSYGRVTGKVTSTVAIALGTNTSGDYVEALVAGTGITLANNAGEGATPTISLTDTSFDLGSTTISLGDIVSTITGLTSVTSSAFYGDLTGDVDAGTVTATTFIGSLTGNASTADAWSSGITISLGGVLSGSVSFDGTGNATLTASYVLGSVTLGTDTSGDFVKALTAGTGVSIDLTNGANVSPTISIGQAVGTTDSVTFGSVYAASVHGYETLIAPTTSGAPSATPSDGAISVDTANGALYFRSGSAWVEVGGEEIVLGTGTTGDYVASLVAGTGVTLAGNTGEGATPTISIGQDVGTSSNVTFNSVTVSGDLTVNGTTTTINSTTLSVDDKNIELGSVASPDNATADGGGITLKGATDKTFNWVSSTASWTSSENIDLASGKTLKIAGTDVLSSGALSSAVSITGSNITLSTLSSTADGRIAWDTSSNKILVGDGSTTLEFAPSTAVFNSQGASYTLVLGDKDKIVEMNSASANTLTVPLNSSVAYPVGTQITILQVGAGQTTVAGSGGVTVNGTPGLKLRAQWSSATLIKRSTDSWVLIGDLSA